jgi:hypothetical protein
MVDNDSEGQEAPAMLRAVINGVVVLVPEDAVQAVPAEEHMHPGTRKLSSVLTKVLKRQFGVHREALGGNAPPTWGKIADDDVKTSLENGVLQDLVATGEVRLAVPQSLIHLRHCSPRSHLSPLIFHLSPSPP